MATKNKTPPGVPRRNPDLGHVLHRVGTANDGLPIYVDALPVLAEILRDRIKNERQNVVGVIGSTGSGKSTVAINLCLLMDPFFSFQKDYIYSIEDLIKKLDGEHGECSPVSLFDEGSIILNSLNFSRKGDKDIVVLFDTMRSRGWTTVICTPELRNLNNRVREDHLNFLITCGHRPLSGYGSRGFFKIHKKIRGSQFSNKPYWKPICYGISEKLPKKVNDEYQRYKARSQDRLIEDIIRKQKAEE